MAGLPPLAEGGAAAQHATWHPYGQFQHRGVDDPPEVRFPSPPRLEPAPDLPPLSNLIVLPRTTL